MTDKVALYLAIAILAAAGADALFNEGRILFMVAQRVLELLRWAAFWR
ncbi:hypothetical protein KUV65_00860 [Maritalea mobilis]|uniref:Glyceraldehyde-3-phosphate dehydrogenase n=1 Tax=[Roseibacterium] beibuensis TaxID=1193142 RepID=A0ABP9LME2_9RHOB|nr:MULTISPECIES: hypothetical protein [Alphaproteobacteria]MBY6199899.1 hypothetical protein [Maritalea mobilis]MCS6625847.1 hypothetical protein [Roseibacterium beibuensis]